MPQQNQSTEQNKQVVQRFVEECWNQGNLNKASEFLTDQVRFHDAVFPGLSPGIQNVKNHIERRAEHFPICDSPSTTPSPNATRSSSTGQPAEPTRDNSSGCNPPSAR